MAAAAQTQEPQETQATQAEQTPKREPDTTPPGQIIQAAREFRKAYRAMGGARAESIEEARKEATELRKKVASLVNDPEKMNEAIKDMRKAEGRVDRMTNTDGNKRVHAVDALKALRDLVNAQLDELSEDEEGEDEA